MLENYGNLIDCAGSDGIVRVEAFANCEPVSIFDDEKTLKKGIFKTRKMSQAEKCAVYEKAKGVGHIFKISTRKGLGQKNQPLAKLDGLFVATVFEMPSERNAKMHGCILNEEGDVIGKFALSYSKLETLKLNKDLNDSYTLAIEQPLYLLADENIFSIIARTVAQNTILECGQFKEEEFETAKAVPAQIFVANPDFAGEVLSEVEKALSEELARRKESGQKTTSVICAGARIGRCLKEIFKQKIEEGRQVTNGIGDSSVSTENSVEDGFDDNDIEEIETINSDEYVYDCDDETTGFPEGTFDADELKKIAQNGKNK